MKSATQKLSVKQICEERGISRKELQSQTSLSASSIASAFDGGRYGLKDTTACIIARALGMDMDEIAWVNGYSTAGRPPFTGIPVKTPREELMVCPDCHLALPVTKQCGNCE